MFEIWYQTHFFHYEYFKYIFSQYILNYSFHIILNNNTWKLLPNRLLVFETHPLHHLFYYYRRRLWSCKVVIYNYFVLIIILFNLMYLVFYVGFHWMGCVWERVWKLKTTLKIKGVFTSILLEYFSRSEAMCTTHD